jgi:fructan beta-fructosidase
VLYAADGKYLLGDFDGKEFKPDFKEKKQLWYGKFYAAQTFDVPPPVGPRPARRVQIGWGQGITFPGMPFNQQMTIPVELRLAAATNGDGVQLVALPVRELQSLRDADNPVAPVRELRTKEPVTLADDLDAFEMTLTPSDTPFVLDLRGTKLGYDADKKTLTCNGVTAPVERPQGVLLIHLFVDRGSVEVFANSGRVAMSVAAIPDEKNRKVQLIPQGMIAVHSASVYRMKSAWEK